MGSNIFQRVARNAPVLLPQKNVQVAREWFRDQARTVYQVNTGQMLNASKTNVVRGITKQQIGDMYLYLYDPKWKDKLPYYDMFPLIFVLEVYNDGWLGLNLHYLPPVFRAKLMDALYETTLMQGDKMKMAARYSFLKGAKKFRLFQPCIKRYLRNHVSSKILYIEPSQWDIALMLPTQKFVKKSEEQVWNQSRKVAWK